MVIWLNGAYGSGKSTLAKMIKELRPDSLIFDAEKVGDAIRDNLEPVDYHIEYPDYPIWRETAAKLLILMAEKAPGLVLVPMTVLHEEYMNEISDFLSKAGVPFLHIILDLPSDIIEERIIMRGEEADCWCNMQKERCTELLAKLSGHRFDGKKSVDELAEELLSTACSK